MSSNISNGNYNYRHQTHEFRGERDHSFQKITHEYPRGRQGEDSLRIIRHLSNNSNSHLSSVNHRGSGSSLNSPSNKQRPLHVEHKEVNKLQGNLGESVQKGRHDIATLCNNISNYSANIN